MKEANEHDLKTIGVRNHQLSLRRQQLENEHKQQQALEELHRKRKQEQGAQELVQFQLRIANVWIETVLIPILITDSGS